MSDGGGSYIEAWLSRMRLRIQGNVRSLAETDRMRHDESRAELKGRILLLVLVAGSMAYCAFSVGRGYWEGVDAYKRGDYQTSREIWEPLAKDGLAEAQFLLGRLYREGKGVDKNDKIAFGLFERASEQGLVSAQANLAWYYTTGAVVEVDFLSAYKWASIALELNDSRYTSRTKMLSDFIEELGTGMSAQEMRVSG